MNKKLKAYTIFEVVVSMVIMSIISVIVFVLFSSFMKQLAVYNETNTKITAFSILKNNLKREFYLSKRVTGSQNSIEIELNDTTFISYTFDEERVIKKYNTQIDTTFLTISNYQINRNIEDNINQISFDCILFGESIPLVLNNENNLNTNLDYEN